MALWCSCRGSWGSSRSLEACRASGGAQRCSKCCRHRSSRSAGPCNYAQNPWSNKRWWAGGGRPAQPAAPSAPAPCASSFWHGKPAFGVCQRPGRASRSRPPLHLLCRCCNENGNYHIDMSIWAFEKLAGEWTDGLGGGGEAVQGPSARHLLFTTTARRLLPPCRQEVGRDWSSVPPRTLLIHPRPHCQAHCKPHARCAASGPAQLPAAANEGRPHKSRARVAVQSSPLAALVWPRPSLPRPAPPRRAAPAGQPAPPGAVDPWASGLNSAPTKKWSPQQSNYLYQDANPPSRPTPSTGLVFQQALQVTTAPAAAATTCHGPCCSPREAPACSSPCQLRVALRAQT